MEWTGHGKLAWQHRALEASPGDRGPVGCAWLSLPLRLQASPKVTHSVCGFSLYYFLEVPTYYESEHPVITAPRLVLFRPE